MFCCVKSPNCVSDLSVNAELLETCEADLRGDLLTSILMSKADCESTAQHFQEKTDFSGQQGCKHAERHVESLILCDKTFIL